MFDYLRLKFRENSDVILWFVDVHRRNDLWNFGLKMFVFLLVFQDLFVHYQQRRNI